MKILVIGASRGIGLEVVKLALARGHDVTALVRDSSSSRGSAPETAVAVAAFSTTGFSSRCC